MQGSRQNSPAIIFLDEIDGLATKRTEGDAAAGMHNRVLSTLLTEMDGLQVRLLTSGVETCMANTVQYLLPSNTSLASAAAGYSFL